MNYETRVQAYESQGITRSDAQGIVDAEDTQPVKSTTPVRLHGNGNNGNWALRARIIGAAPVYLGHQAGYTMHQALAAMSRDTSEFEPLPGGVTVTIK